ncbi:MAG: response regulator transcription factor, partial [Caldicoprobacterales bacterium]
IILDIMLPDGNGYDFCRYVRKHSDIPIIFLTSYDEEVNIVLGLDIGGDDYIIKPFRVMELMSRIKAVLRRHKLAEQKKPNYWISGNIKINPESGKVTKNNNEIVLTPVEYKLLLTFVKHPHQVLTRGQILECLWDIDGEFVDDNTLSVYIRRLREKIEDNPSKPSYIKTIRGVGYKWDYDDQ